MLPSPPSSPSRVGAFSAVALVTGAVLFGLGVPWLLPAVTAGLLIAAFAVRLSWSGAMGAATVVSAAALAGAMAVLPRLGVPVTTGLVVLFVALGAGAAAALWWSGGPRLPDHDDKWLASATAIVALGVALFAIVGHARNAGVSWAMWNDGIYHLTGTRQILADGGLLASSGNRDPLANEVLAIATAPGRGSVAPQDLLQFDVGRQALVIVLMLVWLGILASVIVATAVPPKHRYIRAAVAIGIGALPWTWFISGFALRFGFTNALVSMVVLLAAWLIWSAAPQSPVLASALLMPAAVALLAAWAVLAVVPMGWGAWIIWRYRSEHLALRGAGATAWFAVMAASAAYAGWVTAPGVSTSDEAGLSAEGGFFEFAAFAPALVLMVLLALAWVTSRSTGDMWSRTGSFVFGFAALVGLAVLLSQRMGSDATLWGYYPQKYTWVLCVPAIVIAARLVAQAVSLDLRRGRDRLAAPAVIVGIAIVVMLIAPPSASPLVARGGGVAMVLPVLTIVDGAHGTLADDLGYLSAAAPVLFAHSEPDRPVLLARYLPDTVAEGWVNEWTVELARSDGSTMSRRNVQRLDLREPADLCELLATSNRPVTVLSRDQGLLDRARGRCPSETAIWTLAD
ncbi:hypothetical protein [Aeromicrobium sp. P5_D10]